MCKLFSIFALIFGFQVNASNPNIPLTEEEKKNYIEKGNKVIELITSDTLYRNNLIEHLKQENLEIYERSKTVEDSASRIIDIGTKLYKGMGNFCTYWVGESKIEVLDTLMTPSEATEHRKKMLQDVIVLIWALEAKQKQPDPSYSAYYPLILPIKLEGEKARKIGNFLNLYLILASQKETLQEIEGPVSLLINGTQTVYKCDCTTYLPNIKKLREKFAFTTGKLNGCTGYKSSWEDIDYVSTKIPDEISLSNLKNTRYESGIDMIFASNEGTKSILPHCGSAIRFGMSEGEGNNLFIQIERFGLVDADSQVQYLGNKFRFMSPFDHYFSFCYQTLTQDKTGSESRVPPYHSGDKLPYQGWKIHIPLNETNAFIGIRVLNYLLKEKIFFKTLSNHDVIKNIPSTDINFGKEIEIYAETAKQYIELVNNLDELIDEAIDDIPTHISFSQNLYENTVGEFQHITSASAILNPSKSEEFENKTNAFAFLTMNHNKKKGMRVCENMTRSCLIAQNRKGQFLKFSEIGRKELGLNILKNNPLNIFPVIPFSDYYPCPYSQDPWIARQHNQNEFKPKPENLKKNYSKHYKYLKIFQEHSEKVNEYLIPVLSISK